MEFIGSSVWWLLFIGASASFAVYQLGRLGTGTKDAWLRRTGTVFHLLMLMAIIILTGWLAGVVAFIATIPVSVALLLVYRKLRGDDLKP